MNFFRGTKSQTNTIGGLKQKGWNIYMNKNAYLTKYIYKNN